MAKQSISCVIARFRSRCLWGGPTYERSPKAALSFVRLYLQPRLAAFAPRVGCVIVEHYPINAFDPKLDQGIGRRLRATFSACGPVGCKSPCRWSFGG